MVFERLTEIAKAELSEWMNVGTLTPRSVDNTTLLYMQTFDADGSAGGHRKGSVRVLEVDPIEDGHTSVAGIGRHFIGFLSDPNRVLVCSTTCLEPTRRTARICPAAIESIRLEGDLAPEPSTSAIGSLLRGFYNQPASLAGLGAGLLISLLGIVAVIRSLLLRTASA